jgi:drug/metabolite transporter (DMT)-like permease
LLTAAGAMSSAVLAATVAAAAAHAGWNAIAHWITDKVVALALVNAGALACAIPLVVIAAPPAPASRGYLVASAIVHVAYNGVLMLAYRLGDFNQTYPLGRGTSPVVVTVLAVVFAHEIPGSGQVAGISLIFVGLAWLVIAGRRQHPSGPAPVLAAFAVGILIATYTTIDGLGVRRAGSTLGYIGWLMMLEDATLVIAALALRGRRLCRDVRPVAWIGLLGGVLSIAAYGLVLWAQTHAPLATVAAVRESSIVIGALIGALVFKERFGRARLAATITVALGITAVYLA